MKYTRIAELKEVGGVVYTANLKDIINNWVYDRSAILTIRHNDGNYEIYGFPKDMNIEIALRALDIQRYQSSEIYELMKVAINIY